MVTILALKCMWFSGRAGGDPSFALQANLVSLVSFNLLAAPLFFLALACLVVSCSLLPFFSFVCRPLSFPFLFVYWLHQRPQIFVYLTILLYTRNTWFCWPLAFLYYFSRNLFCLVAPVRSFSLVLTLAAHLSLPNLVDFHDLS